MSREKAIELLEMLHVEVNDKKFREALAIAIHDVQVADIQCGFGK